MSYQADRWWESKRIYGALVMIVVFIAAFFGYDFGDELQDKIVEVLVTVGAAVSAILAIWSKLVEAVKAKE